MILALLAGLTALLVLFQYVTLAKLTVLPPSLSFLSYSDFRDAVVARVDFGVIDAGLAASIVVCCVAIVVAEARSGQLTRLLRQVFTGERCTVAGLLLVGLVSVRFYFAPGAFPWAADSAQHIIYTDLVARSLAQAEVPGWGPTSWARGRRTCSTTASCSSWSAACCPSRCRRQAPSS